MKRVKTEIRECRICGKTFVGERAICDECLKKMEEEKKPKRNWGRIVFTVIVVAGVAAFGKLLYDNDGETFFSSLWMRRASDEELSEKREMIRQEYCNNNDERVDNKLYWLLAKFDDEMSRRAWGDQEPCGPSFHREHGWYLDNDD